MTKVKVSPKYQVVIPKNVRQSLKIKPGQTYRMIEYGKNIMMVPVRSIKEGYGSLEGIDTDPKREKEDREI